MAFATFLLANNMLEEYKMIKKLFIKYQSRDIYKLTKQLQDFSKKALKKLKGLLPESAKGQISLEVIAEDTYFRPWQSDFAVETAKKVTVEVHSQSKPLIESTKPTVKVKDLPVTLSEKQHVINIMRVLISENINLKNLSVKRTKLNTVIAEYIQSNPVEQEQVQPIVEKVIKVLTKKR